MEVASTQARPNAAQDAHPPVASVSLYQVRQTPPQDRLSDRRALILCFLSVYFARLGKIDRKEHLIILTIERQGYLYLHRFCGSAQKRCRTCSEDIPGKK
jgi:hypothetical protein